MKQHIVLNITSQIDCPSLRGIMQDYLRSLAIEDDDDDEDIYQQIATRLAFDCAHLLLVIRLYINTPT